MRDILFRGKSSCGAWVQGDLIHRKIWSSEFEVIRVDDSGFDNYIEYEVATDTIGQYTGLTDKNGKKIFEGDIVACFNEIRTVEYNIEYAMFQFSDNDKVRNVDGLCFCCDHDNAEVIGNIHDNPELLEVK